MNVHSLAVAREHRAKTSPGAARLPDAAPHRRPDIRFLNPPLPKRHRDHGRTAQKPESGRGAGARAPAANLRRRLSGAQAQVVSRGHGQGDRAGGGIGGRIDLRLPAKQGRHPAAAGGIDGRGAGRDAAADSRQKPRRAAARAAGADARGDRRNRSLSRGVLRAQPGGALPGAPPRLPRRAQGDCAAATLRRSRMCSSAGASWA